MVEVAIRGNAVVTPTGLGPAVVLVSDGLIAAVLADLPDGFRGEVIDLPAGRVLMPGLIDPHVHINEPGRTNWEGFNTATQAALAGGLTTLVDMPLNASPVTTTVAAFEQKMVATDGQLHTNCGFWGGWCRAIHPTSSR